MPDQGPGTGGVDAGRIAFHGVTKAFRDTSGSYRLALRDLSLSVEPGEFCALVGPTGCGKSTMLSLASGLETATAGSVLVDAAHVVGVPSQIGFVFQTDAVFPWRTVLGNVSAGPRFRGETRRRARGLARDWIRRVGLAGFEGHYPHQLSGGMRKRVALAQTLVNQPRVLLMDEPFSALDVQTRQIMAGELLGLWELTRPTVMFVTHDLEEAIALADRVIVLTAGPARVKAEFAIDLPRPRDVREIRTEGRFTDIYEQIWSSLRDEVGAAHSDGV